MLKGFGYAANWRQMQPLIELDAEGIGLIKVEDQFFIDSGLEVKVQLEPVMKTGPEKSKHHNFKLEEITGSDLLFYYIAFSFATKYVDDEEAEKTHVLVANKFVEEFRNYMNLNLVYGPDLPCALRLLDPEIIFSRYLSDEKIFRNSSIQITADLVERMPSLEKKMGPFYETMENLYDSWKDFRGGDFCVSLPDLTARQVYVMLDVIAKRRPDSDTAIVLPYATANNFLGFVQGTFLPVLGLHQQNTGTVLKNLRLGLSIESKWTQEELKTCFDLGASWFIFGTNDLTSSILQRERFTDWDRENQKYKFTLHPDVQKEIEKNYQWITELSQKRFAQTGQKTYVGFAGKPASAKKSIDLWKGLSQEKSIVHYFLFHADDPNPKQWAGFLNEKTDGKYFTRPAVDSPDKHYKKDM